MTPDQYCQDRAVKSGSSFYYCFRFLSQEKRRAMTALYAFCREVDDVVDECSDIDVAQKTLSWWHQELHDLYQDAPTHPVTRALQPFIHHYDLPIELFFEILEGMHMDLVHARYPNFEALKVYCHKVAGVVGLLSSRVFGYSDAQTLEYADCLGLALQLTNIIRDVGEDARRGRIYLPMDELAQFSCPASDILAYRETQAFGELMRFQIERAQKTYDEALALLPKNDRRDQWPGLVMAAIYRDLLQVIALDDPRKVLNQRFSLTPLRKLWCVWKTSMTLKR